MRGARYAAWLRVCGATKPGRGLTGSAAGGGGRLTVERVRPPDRAEPRNGRAAVTSRADDVTVEIACARVPGGVRLAARRSPKMQIPFYCNS